MAQRKQDQKCVPDESHEKTSLSILGSHRAKEQETLYYHPYSKTAIYLHHTPSRKDNNTEHKAEKRIRHTDAVCVSSFRLKLPLQYQMYLFCHKD